MSTESSTGFAANCSSSPERPGRDGLLRLTFARRGDATILRRCRYTLPLQVLAPLALADGACYLLLLNPTGGVLGGDRLRTEIVLEEDARVCLSTPSATRVYRSSGPPAEMETVVRLGRNAVLEYLPDHLIPHPGSRLRQALRVEMDQGARGIFFEGFAAGRIALGEAWQFRDFDSRTEIFLRGRPVFASRAKISGAPPHSPFKESELPLRQNTAAASGAGAPEKVFPFSHRSPNSSPAAFGRMGGYSYCGSLLLVAGEFENWRELLENLRAELESAPGIFGGASLLAHSGCAVRYLAHSAIDFQAMTKRLWTVARQVLFGLPPLALRKY